MKIRKMLQLQYLHGLRPTRISITLTVNTLEDQNDGTKNFNRFYNKADIKSTVTERLSRALY